MVCHSARVLWQHAEIRRESTCVQSLKQQAISTNTKCSAAQCIDCCCTRRCLCCFSSKPQVWRPRGPREAELELRLCKSWQLRGVCTAGHSNSSSQGAGRLKCKIQLTTATQKRTTDMPRARTCHNMSSDDGDAMCCVATAARKQKRQLQPRANENVSRGQGRVLDAHIHHNTTSTVNKRCLAAHPYSATQTTQMAARKQC